MPDLPGDYDDRDRCWRRKKKRFARSIDFPVLRKPFLATDVMNQIRGRLSNGVQSGR